MGALCCAHNREPIKSIDDDDEHAGLTANDDDDDGTNIIEMNGTPEPELEYPEKQKIAGQSIKSKINPTYSYLCDTVKNCQSTLNIQQIIKYYISWISNNRNKDNDKGIHWYIHKKFGQTYHQYNYSNILLINDFNHILFKHNHEISIILQSININKLYDAKTNQFILIRNNRNRSEFEECMKIYVGFQDLEEIHTQQLCDKIYCFLFNNINITDNNDDDNDDDDDDKKSEMNVLINSHQNQDNDEYIYIDKEFEKIQNNLKDKKINFRKLRGFDRINNQNKFVTNLSDENNKSLDNCSGFRYYYWSYYKNKTGNDLWNIGGYQYKDWFINKKYSSLKEEMLNSDNHHSGNNLFEWNLLMKTATNYLHSDYCKHNMLCNTVSWETEYEISKGSMINISHLLVILLYCNDDSFRTELIRTYRRIPLEETDESLKERHSKFYHVGKYLRELVECFGAINDINDDNKENIKEKEEEYYYHSIHSSLLLMNKITRIKCPFSVTNDYEIIYMNTNNENGLILQLNDDYGYTKYFNCQWISDFVNEGEMLFIGGFNPLVLNTIISIKNGVCHNYKIYWNALYIIKILMKGQLYKHKDKNNLNETLQNVARRLITNKIYTVYTDWESLPIYIEKVTNYYFLTLIKIHINYKSIVENEENGGYKFLEQLLLCTNNDDDKISFINMDIFKSLFPNLKEIIINFNDCDKEEYGVDSKLFSYILLHLKSVNNWNQIIISLASNYEEETLSNTINSYKDQFEHLNWTLLRQSYKNKITICNNKTNISFLS